MSFSPAKLWEDLRRRRVFQVAAIYAAGAWAIVQVADVFQEPLGIPGWFMTALSAAVITGFPIAVILAWLFDVGPKGVVRTRPGSATGVTAILVSLGLLGAGTAGLYFLVDPADDKELIQLAGDFEPDPNSVAVLPFVDYTPDKSLQHFGYGIAGVLIDQLSQIGELMVISDRSSRAVPEGLDVREIGRTLNVARLVEGTVQSSGSQLRVTAQLVDTRSGEALWTRRFDPDDTDIFAIQDQIALAVADAIDVVIAPDVREHILRPASDSEAAYELYLRGRHSMSVTEIRGSYADAIGYFEQALDLDPQLAPAWAGLATAIYWHGRSGFTDFEEARERSWQASNRALELDPRLGEAYAHRIWLYGGSEDVFEKQREAYERAVEYNPSWPYSYVSFGLRLVQMELFDAAIEVLQRGLDRQPFRPDPLLRANLALAYVGQGDYERGMRMLAANYLDHKGTNKESQYLLWFAGTIYNAERYDEAAALLAIGRRDGLDNARGRWIAASASLRMGRLEEAEQHIARAEALLAEESAAMEGYHPETPFVESTLGRISLMVGDEQRVMELLRRVTRFYWENPEGIIENFRKYDICYWNVALRRYEDAAEWTQRLVVTHVDVENLTMAAFAHRRIGATELAESYLEQAAEVLEETPDSRLKMIMASVYYATSGETEQALDMLERAYDAHYRNLVYLVQMPLFDPIRDEPRFTGILGRIRNDVAEMSRRYDEAAENENFESLVEHYLQPQMAANLNY